MTDCRTPSAETLASLCGVSLAQARRWRKQGLPVYVRRLVALLVDGDLGEIDPQWHGWRLRGGHLSYGESASPSIMASQLSWFEWYPKALNEAHREIAHLRKKGLDVSQRQLMQQTWAALNDTQTTTARALASLSRLIGFAGETANPTSADVIPITPSLADKRG